MASTAPPAANGTMMRMARVGQACDRASRHADKDRRQSRKLDGKRNAVPVHGILPVLRVTPGWRRASAS